MGKIGAFDTIDKLLVKKYNGLQVNNFDTSASAIPPEDIERARNAQALMDRNFVMVAGDLAQKCARLNAMRAKYRKARTLQELQQGIS